MSSWQKIYRKLLNLPLSLLVKTHSIPSDPVADLELDLERPIIYILPFRSNTDLMTLRSSTQELGLPDPLSPLEIDGKPYIRYVYISDGPSVFGSDGVLPQESIDLFTALLEQHKQDAELDLQVIPAAILWGRKPGKEESHKPVLRPLNGPEKFCTILGRGRDCMVRLSTPVSLRYMADNHGTDDSIAHKLARVAKIHFSRQQLAASGPKLPDRQALFKRLLASKAIEKVVAEEAQSRDVPVEKVRKEAIDMMEEIAADFSYSLIKRGERFLGWLWNKLYQG